MGTGSLHSMYCIDMTDTCWQVCGLATNPVDVVFCISVMIRQTSPTWYENRMVVKKMLPLYLHLATSEMWCWSGGRKILTELSLCYSIVYHSNGVQWYKQFLQVGRLGTVGLWFSSLFSECLCVFILQSSLCCIYLNCVVTFFTFQWAEPGEIGHWPGWLCIVLQCCDSDSWVIWPVKLSPKWPVVCQMGC